MTKAVYPGSFDPMTNGHLDIITRASSIFDEVVVCVMVNPAKHYLFPEEKRMTLIRESLEGLDNVVVDAYDGLLVNYAQSIGANVIVKGLRNSTDFDYENNMEFYNKRMGKDIETVFLLADHAYAHLSSSAVRELLSFGGDLTGLVPKVIADALTQK